MEKLIYQFNEVLTCGYGCILLGDPYTLKHFQDEHELSENLQIAFTTLPLGDKAVETGAMIYIGNTIEPLNVGYTVYFNFTDDSLMENSKSSRILHNVSGYVIHVENQSICLYTWPYLEQFNLQTIKKLQELSVRKGYSEEKVINGTKYLIQNSSRQMVNVENGYYDVRVIAGYIEDEAPTFEFVIKKTTKTVVSDNLESLISYDYSLFE